MNLTELVREINQLADEAFPTTTVLSWINDAIAQINIEMDANFPFLTTTQGEDVPAFPEKWQRMLIIPFGAGRVKQQDSSQFEYQDLYDQFLANLKEFKAKYTVPDTYKDVESASNSSVNPIFTNHMYRGGW